MPEIRITQEPDDPMALRASVGGQPDIGYYLVIRGDPAAVLTMLRAVVAEAERELPTVDRADRLHEGKSMRQRNDALLASQSLRNGYSRHLGGPWYIGRMPDSGRLRYHKDAGTGTVEIPLHLVPADVRRKGGL